MAFFRFFHGQEELLFDMKGKVLDPLEEPLGRWTCDGNNALLFQRDPEGVEDPPSPEVIEVSWAFNPANQLVMMDPAGDVLFNFNTDTDFPAIELRKAQLMVKPEDSFEFAFFLQGEWSLDEHHQLELELDGDRYQLDGYFSDHKSRLTYHLPDKEQPWISHRLTFTGRWDVHNEDGNPNVRFFYTRFDDSEGLFELPGQLRIQRGTNQFQYTYDKESESFGITLVGYLKISENFEISYSLDKQESREGDELVAQTAFSLQTRFYGDRFQGDLSMVLVRDDGNPGNHVLSVSGDYTAVLGDVKVIAGFRYSQVRNDRRFTRTFGFGGAIIWKENQFVYEFSTGGGQVALTLGADIRTIPGVDISAKTTIVGENGRLKKVTFLLGVSF